MLLASPCNHEGYVGQHNTKQAQTYGKPSYVKIVNLILEVITDLEQLLLEMHQLALNRCSQRLRPDKGKAAMASQEFWLVGWLVKDPEACLHLYYGVYYNKKK